MAVAIALPRAINTSEASDACVARGAVPHAFVASLALAFPRRHVALWVCKAAAATEAEAADNGAIRSVVILATSASRVSRGPVKTRPVPTADRFCPGALDIARRPAEPSDTQARSSKRRNCRRWVAQGQTVAAAKAAKTRFAAVANEPAKCRGLVADARCRRRGALAVVVAHSAVDGAAR